MQNLDSREEHAQYFMRSLNDPSLRLAYPSPPPAKPFFKHTDKNVQMHGGYDAPHAAPPGAYKLLMADYAWLDEPGKEKMVKPFTPDPPEALSQTKFLSRARITLVKLQTQVKECIHESLVQAADAFNDQLDMVRPRPPNGSVRDGQPAATGSAQQQPHGGAPAAGGSKKASLGSQELDNISDLVHARLNAMFADSMDDVVDELWGALQVAGAAQQAMVGLAGAMAARDSELEQIMAARIAAAEVSATKARVALKECEDQREAERVKWQAQLLQVQAHTRHLENNVGIMNAQLKEKEKLQHQIDALKMSHAAAMAIMEERMQVVLEQEAAKMEELRALHRGAHVVLHEKDKDLESARNRLAEQLTLLEAAFVRRDVEIQRTKDAEGTLFELVGMLADEGAAAVGEWLEKCEAAAVPSSLQPGELLKGEYGLAKALLAAARGRGAARSIAALKGALPEYLPRYDPPEEPQPPEVGPEAPKIVRMEDMFVRDALPELWHRLAKAPLSETLPLPVLCRHIGELYAAKEADDEANDGTGTPRQSIHAAIYKLYLAKHVNVSAAEQAIVALIQSVRTHSLKNERVSVFGQLLALKAPAIPTQGFYVLRALERALRAPLQGPAAAAQPPSGQLLSAQQLLQQQQAQPFLEDDGGVVCWVQPMRLRSVISGLFERVTDGGSSKAALKRVLGLKPEPARSKPHFGMVDADVGLRCCMDAWLSYYHDVLPARLAALVKEHDMGGDGLLTFYEFKDLATNAAAPGITVTEVSALELMHACLTDGVAAAREGRPSAIGRPRGSINPESFTKACLAKGLVGSVPQAAGSADLRRLGSALLTLQSLVRSLLGDARKEGITVDGGSRMEPELIALLSLVAAAEKEGGMDMQGMDAAWGFITSTMRALSRVHDAVGRKRADDKQAAAEAFMLKEKELLEQVAKAKAEADIARDKAAAAEATATAAAANGNARGSSAGRTAKRPTSATRKPPGNSASTKRRQSQDVRDEGVEEELVEEEAGTQHASPLGAAQRPMSGSSHASGGRPGSAHVPSAYTADGGAQRQEQQEQEALSGLQQSESMRSVDEFKQALRRAEAAETKFVELRVEHAQALERLEQLEQRLGSRSGRNSKGRRSKPGNDAQRLLGGDASQADETIGRLLEIAGHLHGMASSLPSSRPASAMQRPRTSQADLQASEAVGPASFSRPDSAGQPPMPAIREHAALTVDAATSPRPTSPPRALPGSQPGRVAMPGRALPPYAHCAPLAAPRDPATQLLVQQAHHTDHPMHRCYFMGAAAGASHARSLLGRPSSAPSTGHISPRHSKGTGMATGLPPLNPTLPQQAASTPRVPPLDIQGSQTYAPSPDALRTLAQAVTSMALEAAHLSAAAHAQIEDAQMCRLTPRTQLIGQAIADANTCQQPLVLMHSDRATAASSATLLSSAGASTSSPRTCSAGRRPDPARPASGRPGSARPGSGRPTSGCVPKRLPMVPSQQGGEGGADVEYEEALGIQEVEDDLGEAMPLPELRLAHLDPSALLCRCFRLCDKEVQELGMGLMAIVQAAGGYPVIDAQGRVVAQDGSVLSPLGEDELPGLDVQADKLRQLYVATAALVAAQHNRGTALREVQQDLAERLDNLQGAAQRLAERARKMNMAEVMISDHLLGMAAANKQLDLAFAAIASLSRHAATATEAFIAFSSSSSVSSSTVAGAADPQVALQQSAAALGSLREDLSHVRGALMDVRTSYSMPGVPRGAVPTTAATSLAAVEALVNELAGSAKGAQADLSYASGLLHLTPIALFERLHHGHSRPVSPSLYRTVPAPLGQPGQASAAGNPVLSGVPIFPHSITPATSPRPDKAEVQSEARPPEWLDLALTHEQRLQASELPPGEPYVRFAPSLARRSELSPQRYRARFGMAGSAVVRRSMSPETTTDQQRVMQHTVVMGNATTRYARRPYTARAYVEHVMQEGQHLSGEAGHGQQWPRSVGGALPGMLAGHLEMLQQVTIRTEGGAAPKPKRQWQDWAPSPRSHAPWEPHLQREVLPSPITTAGAQLIARLPRPLVADVRPPMAHRAYPPAVASEAATVLRPAELSGWGVDVPPSTSMSPQRGGKQPVAWGSAGARVDSEGRIVSVAQRQDVRLSPLKL